MPVDGDLAHRILMRATQRAARRPAPGSAPAPGRHRENESRNSNPDTGSRTSTIVAPWARSPALAPLLSGQYEELGISHQYLPPRLDPSADILHPLLGNVVHPLLPFRRESERPDGVAAALGTVAGGPAAEQTAVSAGRGGGRGEMKSVAPAQTCSFGAGRPECLWG